MTVHVDSLTFNLPSSESRPAQVVQCRDLRPCVSSLAILIVLSRGVMSDNKKDER
jgi:hypothetical protein